MRLAGTTLLLAFMAAPAAMAQSNIDPTNKYGWGENIGFLNWRDANAGAQGVVVHHTFLSGHVWAENTGWIRLGNGADPGPGTCFQYPAPGGQTGATYGVNINDSGHLSGYGWGENIGWVNFGTGPFVPAEQAARYDRAAHRLRGYAWAENAGWINLDSSDVFVGTTLCRPDTDGDGTLAPADIALFVNIWFCSLQNGTTAGDFDDNGASEPADIALFVNVWFAALAGGC